MVHKRIQGNTATRHRRLRALFRRKRRLASATTAPCSCAHVRNVEQNSCGGISIPAGRTAHRTVDPASCYPPRLGWRFPAGDAAPSRSEALEAEFEDTRARRGVWEMSHKSLPGGISGKLRASRASRREIASPTLTTEMVGVPSHARRTTQSSQMIAGVKALAIAPWAGAGHGRKITTWNATACAARSFKPRACLRRSLPRTNIDATTTVGRRQCGPTRWSFYRPRGRQARRTDTDDTAEVVEKAIDALSEGRRHDTWPYSP